MKNGPPYPLGSSDHSASEKKAGWQKSLDKPTKTSYTKISSGKDEQSNEKRGLSDKQKKYIKIGAAAVATALAVYGTYKLADSGEPNRLIVKGKAFVDGTKPTWDKNPDLANKELSVSEIYDNIVVKINPGFGSPGTSNNCRRCTFAYELNRRGFDVSATKSMRGLGQNDYGLLNAIDNTGRKYSPLRDIINYANGDSETISRINRSTDTKFFGTPIKLQKSQAHQNIFNALSKMPNGARGELSVKYNGAGAHSMAWEIIKGKPVIFECQAGKVYDSPESFAFYASKLSTAAFSRIDNIELNEDFLLKWVKNTW